MSEHRPTVKTYALTWGILLALTLLTSLIGLVDLGPFSLAVGVVIALIKASLIAIFFMHALYGSKLIRVVAAGGVAWFLILLGITLADYLTRNWYPFAQR